MPADHHAPSPSTTDGPCGALDTVCLRSADGASATITLHGAHVVSWIPAGGTEMLYLSPRSAFAAGQAIRGGVPVVFPQFSNRGPLTRHGFARVLPWQLLQQGTGQDEAWAVLRLVDSAATRASWDHGFALDMAVRVAGGRLHMALSCRNTGRSSFGFSAALHTYLQTQAIERARLRGLAGRAYWDALDGARKVEQQVAVGFDGELDRVYGGVGSGVLVLEAGATAGDRRLTICQRGFEDVVVWNPGAVKCAALADMPPEGWRDMVCVEAARIERPVVLEPGQHWTGEQHLSLRDA